MKKIQTLEYFHITSRYNLKCVGCYLDEIDKNKKYDLDTKQCLKILDNPKRSNVKQLIVSDGEPLLRLDLE